MKRRWVYTTVLTAAGSYNLTWGGWVAVHPSDLYQSAGIPVPDHPEIAGVLGMVIALYGILYLYDAWPYVSPTNDVTGSPVTEFAAGPRSATGAAADPEVARCHQ